MEYCFQLLPHANLHYREALISLGQAELRCMLLALRQNAPPSVETLGGQPFLCLSLSESLGEKALRLVRQHSALLLLCKREHGALLPLDVPEGRYLPSDLPEVLKYKGKTSATFTRMLLNLALCASDFADETRPLTLLDPLCGKVTAGFCALERGWNAVCVDQDAAALAEADRYFARYLQMRRVKHQRQTQSATVKGRGVPQVVYTLSDTREHYAQNDVRSLRLIEADTALCGALGRIAKADLIVADLPYGIQHAPVDGRRAEPFAALLSRALPAWRAALDKGGAMALSFNTLTLPRQTVISLLKDAGLEPLMDEPWSNFRHFVEQAVIRDVVVARR